MKWTTDELDYALVLIKDGKTYKDISVLLNRTKNSIRTKLSRVDEKYEKYNLNDKNIKCLNCGDVFEKNKNEQKFCSHNCSASYNNIRKDKKHNKLCLNCGKKINKINNCCSQKCNSEYNKKITYNKIESGDIQISHRIIKKYLIEKYGNKCMECGWNEKNIVSGNIPIELEHIDGNSQNNKLDNLKLLCPNCHSLTPTYKVLNLGNGRYNRKMRYQNGKSF